MFSKRNVIIIQIWIKEMNKKMTEIAVYLY